MISATDVSGHPCLALKVGFLDRLTRTMTNEPLDPKCPLHRVPCTVSLWADHFREDLLVTLGRAIEQVRRNTRRSRPCTPKRERRCTCCMISADGPVRSWWSDARISQRSIWPRTWMRSVTGCDYRRQLPTIRLRHQPGKEDSSS